MPCRAKLVLTDILAEPVQVPQILKVAVPNDIHSKGHFRIDLFTDPVCSKHITVITGIPVNMIPDLTDPLILRRLLLEQIIDLYQQLIQNIQILCLLFKHICDGAPKLRIQEA